VTLAFRCCPTRDCLPIWLCVQNGVEAVRHTCAFVVAGAKHVSVVDEAIPEFAATLVRVFAVAVPVVGCSTQTLALVDCASSCSVWFQPSAWRHWGCLSGATRVAAPTSFHCARAGVPRASCGLRVSGLLQDLGLRTLKWDDAGWHYTHDAASGAVLTVQVRCAG
jgi:hypothetical protein